MGYPKKRLAFLVSDKRKEGDGGNRTAKTKKAGRLQVQPLSLDNVHTHVPCLVHTHVHAGVYACPGLFLPSWGDIKKRGRGRIVSVCEKKATEYKCMGLGRGGYAADGKNRPGVMALTVSGREAWGYVGVSWCLVGKTERWGQPHRAWTHDYPCLWTGQYPCLWTSLR